MKYVLDKQPIFNKGNTCTSGKQALNVSINSFAYCLQLFMIHTKYMYDNYQKDNLNKRIYNLNLQGYAAPYISKIENSINYPLPHGEFSISIENVVSNNNVQDISPHLYNWNLPIEELDTTLNNMVNLSLGTCFITASTVLEDKFLVQNGKKVKIFNEKNLQLQSLRAILYQARCAAAHRPFYPEWNIKDEFYLNKWSFSTNNHTIDVDLVGKHGCNLHTDDFGGMKNIFLLFDAVLDAI